MKRCMSRFFVLMLCVLVACQSAMAESCSLDAAALGISLESRWEIVCDAEIAEGFHEPLYEYRFHQEKGSRVAGPLNGLLAETPETRLVLQVGKLDQSRLYSGDDACLLRMTRLAGTPCSERQKQLLEACMSCLEQAGWQPHPAPYAQCTLLELYQSERAAVMGQLTTLESYLRYGGLDTLELDGSEEFVLLAADIDGYPIVPELYGDFSDTDVPMYAGMIMSGDRVLYLDVGCGYVIDRRDPLTGAVLTCEDALRTVLSHAYQMWQRAWSAMAGERDAHLDYPVFWRDYDPRFILRAVEAQPCYYAKDGVLRPCWQVDCRIDVLLSGDEALKDEERHRYVPETIHASYCVDAISGEIVR